MMRRPHPREIIMPCQRCDKLAHLTFHGRWYCPRCVPIVKEEQEQRKQAAKDAVAADGRADQ